jgi:hypothetical protein
MGWLEVLEEELLAVEQEVDLAAVQPEVDLAVLLVAPEVRCVARVVEDAEAAAERTSPLQLLLLWMPRWINTILMEHRQKLI